MKALGLENTFLAGEFGLGSPLLRVYKTPANQREDVTTDPDLYNQSTPSDIGMLLEDIYLCADNGQGTFKAVFGDEITQAECQIMIDYLSQNKMPSLLEAGVPDVTEVAHKHGWVTYQRDYANPGRRRDHLLPGRGLHSGDLPLPSRAADLGQWLIPGWTAFCCNL